MTKIRKMSIVTAVLLPIMMIFVMFTAAGCDDNAEEVSALEAAIAEAKGLLSSTVTAVNGNSVPTGSFWATQANKDTLSAAITAAETALSLEVDLETALANLQTAIDLFRNQRQPGLLQGGSNPTPVTITIKNDTGYRVDDIFARLSSTSSWGSSKLGTSESLADGASKTITLSAGTYDIRLVDSDGDSYIKSNQNITANITITFTMEGDYVGYYREPIPAEMRGLWEKDGSTGVSIEFDANSIYLTFGTGMYGTVALMFDSYDSVTNTVTAIGMDFGDQYTFKANVSSNGKLTVSGFTSSSLSSLNGTYTKSVVQWPSNDVWAVFGLSGLTLPAGATVNYVYFDPSYYYSTGYRASLHVELTANSAAHTSLRTQITTITGFSINSEGSVNHSNYQVDMRISYSDGLITIMIDQPAAAEPITLPTNATSLTLSSWRTGNFTSTDEVWYKFEAVSGTNYYVWWDDYDTTPSRLDVYVTVYKSDGTEIFSGDYVETGSNLFQAQGTVYILVENNYYYDAGPNDFRVSYTTSSTRPN